ncbi:hypothetical protein [Lactococcus garvieae]|uniref:Uncharacterized protein n=1 Tax=Lactococcus garvieae TaxID=1363 RepID=A0AA46TVD5_9LACT|nr:hypothetical protein [Lactococcus garvieae]UYT10312.1 hypothetical protein OF801_10285 [Lactococcus garvieae]UYT12335.1 hypothetical protein OF800_10185 [Lactococcus garvieae]
MKLRGKSVHLIALSLLMIFVVLGAVLWGFFQRIRYDEIALTKPGYSLNEDYETTQFVSGSDLYRSWNNNEIIEAPNRDKSYLPQHALVYFDDGDILFTDESTKIDTDGKGEKLKKREIYQQIGEEYQNAERTIKKNNIVKISERNYLFNGSGDLYLNDEKISNVTKPQLLIDKAGSVTVYNEQTKERYLGHLTIKVTDKITFDVSDEMYYVGQRKIDLTKFGGSDNSKYLIDKEKDQETPEDEEKNDESSNTKDDKNNTVDTNNDKSNTVDGNSNSNDASYSRKYDENSALGSNQEKASNEKGKNSSNNDSSLSLEEQLALLDDYESIMKLLEKINGTSKKQIPTVYMLSNQPKSVSAVLSIWANDESDALVGPVEVQVWSAVTNKVISTQYVKKGQNKINVTGLSPNEEYYLGYKYQYDLGDGAGIKTLSMKDDTHSFQTLSVSAIYTVTQINSKSIEATIALDAPVDDIKSAELLVIDAKENKTAFTKALNTNKLINGGEDMTITGLEANTPYRFKVELTYGNNLPMAFEQSQIYYTSSMPKMVSSKASINDLGQYSVEYLWNAGDYTPKTTRFQLVDTESNDVIPLEIIESPKAETLLIPNSSSYKAGKSYEMQLLIDAANTDGQTEMLSYTLPNRFKKAATEKLEKSKKSLALELNNLRETTYRVALQRKTLKVSSGWKEVSSHTLKADEAGKLKTEFELNTLELTNFDYRVVVYDQSGKIVKYIY